MKDLLNLGQTLGRSEMKKLMAGSGDDCYSGSMKCQEFYNKTGCYPATGDSTCKGSDGCNYSSASSSGSCGG